MTVTIKKCTVAEIENTANFLSLVDEYAAEVHVDGAPPIAVKKEIYRNLENLGVFQFFGAYFENVLIGFITVLSTVLPHFGVVMSVSESYFVSRKYRRTGAGTLLRYTAEKYAESVGSPIILISTPSEGALHDVMCRLKEYKKTNCVFFRKLSHVG